MTQHMNIVTENQPIDTRHQALEYFLMQAGWGEAELAPLAGDASFRRYIRVCQSGRTAMVMDAPPEKENVPGYVNIAQFLVNQGYSAPRILAQDSERGLLLLEDLGDDLFTQLLSKNVETISENTLYTAAIELLSQWHNSKVFVKKTNAVALPDYGKAMLLQEVGLLAEWFLPLVVVEKQVSILRLEYLSLWERTLHRLRPLENCFVHRDFHAGNLIWLPGRSGHARVGLLDFQDAVWGDPAYDLVSLLEDARRDVSSALAEEMLELYLERIDCDASRLRDAYAVLGAQRNSKIIGIFTRLWKRDKKAHYLPLLPRVWRYLERDLTHPILAEIRAWTDKNIPPQWRVELKPHA